MYKNKDLIMLSALQHYIFCPRQCALIHIEKQWVENRFTAEGRVMHDKAHEEGFEMRSRVRIERGIPLKSESLGLTGKADVVEFHKQGGDWIPYPVEYKRGKPKKGIEDKIQLCAQAMCLEEMTGKAISQGSLFYGKIRRRFDVCFDDGLREMVVKTINEIREMINTGITPKADYESKCDYCSFLDVCLPKNINDKVGSYLAGIE